MAHIVNAPAGRAVSNTAVCDACKMPKRYVIQLMRMLEWWPTCWRACVASPAVTSWLSLPTRSRC
jgi:hypothetical protein